MVSIIVPAYNSEKSLSRCIESILRQICADFELLLIDDGSTDNTQTICDYYAQLDSRVRVYHKNNEGVSSARNLGLKFAKGEYVTFIDSDDWVDQFYITNLLSHSGEDIDLVISYNWYITKYKQEQEIYPSYKIDNKELFQLMFIQNDMHYHTSPWGKLYKTSIIKQNNLTFDERMHIGEDLVFLYEYMLFSDCIYIASDTNYYYVADMTQSLTKKINNIESELHSYDKICKLLDKTILNKNITDRRALENLNWIVGSYVRRVLNALYYNVVCKKKRLDIISGLQIDLYVKYVKTSSWKEKLYKCLLRLKLLHLYDILRVVIHKINNNQ